MSDFKAVLDTILDVAEKVAPLVGGPAPEAIAAATAVLTMIDTAKRSFPTTAEDRGALHALRPAYEAAVNQRVDKTIADLRG